MRDFEQGAIQGAMQSCKKSVQHGADKISRAVYKGGSIERFFSLPLQFRYGDDAASRLNEDTPLFIEGKHGARDLGRSGGCLLYTSDAADD